MKIGPSYLCFQNGSKIVKNGPFGQFAIFNGYAKNNSEQAKNAKNCSKLKNRKNELFYEKFSAFSKTILIFAVEFDRKP